MTATIAKTGLIIIDELGYLLIDQQGARLLYQVIANAYENRSIIYTTNLEFSRWGTILGDTQMAAAIIDRTVHQGRILRFEGTSYRVKHATMK
ncbi:ATP-binding protein [Mobiluncus mulieris]|uniref:ATP-binding protein n=1 Tax=Mobiluncus mulieris TaxID=2052 RepID=UPI0024B5BE82|nr:ATP-binding protein [Mobiluncus mulieris]